jgi:NADPH:quinone reductase-like Zn-dependent oxidoreductase
MLTSYGAQHVLDYHDTSIMDRLRGLTNGKVDIVFDCVGDEEKTVQPISQLVADGSRVGILLPIRSGGYGNTAKVYMETKIQFPSGVKAVGVRTHHYLNVSSLFEWLVKGI